MIKRVSSSDNFDALAKVLNDSFMTIANEFGLSKESSPSNNAFITGSILKKQLTDSREFYTYYSENNILAGFVAIEKAENETGTFYIEKLAVHPDFRHDGIGRKLMHFASDRIEELGGIRISIALINSNQELKKWYEDLGYAQFSLKSFAHLPFDVCFMDKII